MAMGEVLNQQGVKSLYLIGPNYAAGKNMMTGVQRTFKGEIKGKDLTKWPSQLDFSAELAKAKASGAEALFVFYPGKAGGAFIKQYQQAGLKGVMDLYTVFTVDAISLPKLQAAKLEGVLGSRLTQQWDPTLDNAANKKFVADFRSQYKRYPSFYAAQAYDTIKLIASGLFLVPPVSRGSTSGPCRPPERVFGKCCLDAESQAFYSPVLQERAWTSPIWYTP